MCRDINGSAESRLILNVSDIFRKILKNKASTAYISFKEAFWNFAQTIAISLLNSAKYLAGKQGYCDGNIFLRILDAYGVWYRDLVTFF